MAEMKSTALKNKQAILKWTDDKSMSHIAAMDSDVKRQKIGELLRQARKQRGYVIRQVAEAAGVTAGAVGNWERGANELSMANLQAVSEFLRIDPVALSRAELRFADDPSRLADAEIISDPSIPAMGPMDVEIRGVAVGGDDGDFSFNGEVSGYVRRPPGAAGMRKIFALHILSDSMVPRYDPGEIIYVGGREPVPGDHVVIELFPEGDEAIGKSYVKKFIRRASKDIVCEQYNPKRELFFDRYAIKNMWRIIPNRELLGF